MTPKLSNSNQLSRVYWKMRGVCRTALSAQILDFAVRQRKPFEFAGDADEAELEDLLPIFSSLSPYYQREILRLALEMTRPSYRDEKKQRGPTKQDRM